MHISVIRHHSWKRRHGFRFNRSLASVRTGGRYRSCMWRVRRELQTNKWKRFINNKYGWIFRGKAVSDAE